jgi:hypothetical protein
MWNEKCGMRNEPARKAERMRNEKCGMRNETAGNVEEGGMRNVDLGSAKQF